MFKGYGNCRICIIRDGSCEHFIKCDTQAIEIRPPINFVDSLGLFRAHVMRRTDTGSIQCVPAICCEVLDNAKVREYRCAVTTKHNILGFDIPVDKAFVVGMAQCGGDLP